MKYFIYLIVLLFSFSSYSQRKKIDSLEAQLKLQTLQDSERLNTLNALASEYNIVNPRRGIDLANDAIQLAKQLNKKPQLAAAYKSKAQNLHNISQDSLAMIMYNKATTIQTELKNWKEIGKITFNKGLIYFGQSDYEKANQYNNKAYNIFEKERDSALMGAVLNSIGINQMYRSLYTQALDTYLKAAELYETRHKTNNQGYAGVLTNIGLLYNRLENTDLALKYYNRSLKICRKLNYDLGTANALTNIGNLYDITGESQKALEYYFEALNLMTLIDNNNGIASALTNIGITHINLKNYDKAIDKLKNSIKLYEKLNNTYNLSIVHQNIGVAYLENPESNNEQLNNAKFHFEEALKYAKETNTIKTQAETLFYLSELRAKLNEHKTAYHEFKKATKLRDSFLSIEKKEEIAKIESKYKYDKKAMVLKATHDKEQLIKEAEITHQKSVKNASIIGGSGLIAASIIGFILYRRKQSAVTKSKEAEFNAKVSDTELKALRSQMNPHFIFNSINSIGDYILKNDTKSASDYLSKFAKLMRLTLENSEKKEILLSEDIILLRTYMDIERKRFNNAFNYTISIDKELDPENILVPPMILQPFIENSIIHGLSKKKNFGRVNISFKADKKMLLCSVDDNGIGRQKSHANTSKSMGIAITKSRIEIINKLNNTNGTIAIIDKNQGTRINVSLPMQLAF